MKTIAFTLVLNGMPYIKHQFDIIPEVFDEWYIIEGAAAPVNCTSWCKPLDQKYYDGRFCSTDGTGKWLEDWFFDQDKKKTKAKIHVIKPPGRMWNGKVEMCNEVMKHIKEPCVLMEFDIDEIWSKMVLKDLLKFCKEEAHKYEIDAMQFRCRCWVGPDIRIASTGGYADAEWDWRRLWILRGPSYFISHEPPQMAGTVNILSKESTEKKGWIFDHYSYALESQVEFKENYYGYVNAVNQWKALQSLPCNAFPCNLQEYLTWTWGNTIVTKDYSQVIYNRKFLC